MHLLLGPIFLLLFFCSVFEFHKRVVEHFLRFLLMDCVTCVNSFLQHLTGNYDFGCGFLVFGSFKPAFELLGLFLLFGFGLKVLNFGWFCKPVNESFCDSAGKFGQLIDGIRARNDFGGKCSSKIGSCGCNNAKCLSVLSPAEIDKAELDNESESCGYGFTEEGNDDGEKHRHCDEDKEFDVMALRKIVKIERSKVKSALMELEKERMSAAIAAEESMAMILRLQNEKSLIEMESNQYKRLVEEKLNYDQVLIQSLQWLVSKQESNRTVLENHLELSQKKLMMPYKNNSSSNSIMDHSSSSNVKVDEEEESFTPNGNIEEGAASEI